MRAQGPAKVCTASLYTLCSGLFLIDDDVLRATGVVDFAPYRVDPSCAEADLMPDFFV